MGIRSYLRKQARRVVSEVYWSIRADKEDNYAKNYILVSNVPKSADNELVVAEMDKQVSARGKVATRILREMYDGKE